MNDEQIVKYCKDLIKSNLQQYIDTENSKTIMIEIYNLENDKTNKTLLAHCKGVKELLEKCIKILEENNE